VIRKQPLFALFALLLGPLVKASGLLLLGLYALHLLFSHLKARLPRLELVRWQGRWLTVAIGLLAVGLTVLAAWRLYPWLEHYSSTTARLLGSPRDALPYCTRSIECLPRGFLHFILRMPTASWLIGLGFRAAAGAFLLYMAFHSERGARHLSWAASFLFLYYLYLHGYSHAWYLLSLLPLLSFADTRLRPAMLAMPVAGVAHYVVDFPLNCHYTWLLVGVHEVLGGLIVIVPSTLILLFSQPKKRAREAR
jgi:hypothetical protein